MAENTRKRAFFNQNPRMTSKPIPVPPKIPDSIKQRYPDPGWDKLDEEWENYFKKQEVGKL